MVQLNIVLLARFIAYNQIVELFHRISNIAFFEDLSNFVQSCCTTGQWINRC